MDRTETEEAGQLEEWRCRKERDIVRDNMRRKWRRKRTRMI